jgi:DNA modification methylase
LKNAPLLGGAHFVARKKDFLHNIVHNKDCIAGLKRLSDGEVDLAFADPPFNIGYQYDQYNDALDSEKYLEWSRKWLGEMVRVLKPNGTFWLAIGDEYAAELKVMMTKELKMTCRSWVVWYYTFGVNCVANFTRSHTHLLYMVKDPKSFTFNADSPALRVPSARQLVYGDQRANPKGRLPDNTWVLRPQDAPEAFTPSEDTWYYSRVCGTFKERTGWHTCQMPERLLGRIIEACSKPRDLVLDPFAGSGTTLAVAKKLGRRYLGFELSKKYAQECINRLKSIKPGDALEGVIDPLTSVPRTADGRRLENVKPGKKRSNKSPLPLGEG